METVKYLPEKSTRVLIMDFDSTFIKVESLDQLAEIVFRGRFDKDQVITQISTITKQGMEGLITFPESLARRLQLIKPNKNHIEELIGLLHHSVTLSVERNREFFRQNADRIYFLSGGFKIYMTPVLGEYGIHEDHIFGNRFSFDEEGNVIGCDVTNPLAQERGKVKTIKELGLNKEVYVVGDGYTDYEIKQAGLATKFIAFTENIERKVVIELADVVARNFDDVLMNL